MNRAIVVMCLALLPGCVIAQAQQDYRQEKIDEQRRLALQDQAFVECSSKAICDRAFRLAEEFIVSRSDYRISLVSSTVIETYPSRRSEGLLSLRVTRTLQAGTSERLQLYAYCHSYMGKCNNKLWDALEGFRPYVEFKMMQ